MGDAKGLPFHEYIREFELGQQRREFVRRQKFAHAVGQVAVRSAVAAHHFAQQGDDGVQAEADQARQNKQSIDTLSQEVQQFKTELDIVLKSHQNALTTLDEDMMRLKEKAAIPVEVPPVPYSSTNEADFETGPVPGGLFPDSQDEAPLNDLEDEEDDSNQESQKFIAWMENFFNAIWNWFSGLFN